MNKIVKLTLFLLFIAALSGFLLAYVNGSTAPIIAKAQAADLINGYKEIFPTAEEIVESSIKSDAPEILLINEAKISGKTVGVIYKVATSGYGGKNTFLVAFDLEKQQITGVKILTHTETPGLGAKATEKWFTNRFIGKTTTEDLLIVKKSTEKTNEVEAITAATITSKSIAKGINIAREHFIANFTK
ncbi:MAG: RnfABCDGE type electron transport complex subunit G [Clostridia bacterium]